ncbi:MAG TPA: GTPase, partial [Longimicrobiales bacterium]|nr:GTPase [Longimicrobiales bacterium]
MPANLNHAYYAAEERYREAVTREEKIAALEEMLRVIPKHKGTDKLQADLKSRISRLKRQPDRKRTSTGPSYRVQKEGAGQVALVGPPNSGKSALVAALTHAEPDVAPYPMTTRVATPGMMDFEDVAIQLVDLPPLCDEYVEFWVWDNVRGADLAWLVLSALEPLAGMDLVRRLLDEKALGLVPWTEPHPEDPRAGWTYKPTLMVVTGMDRPSARGDLEAFEELLGESWPRVAVSVEGGDGLEALARATFEALGVI